MMKAILILMLKWISIVAILLCIASGATDEEILQFARGVYAGEEVTVAISGNNLTIIKGISQYDRSVSALCLNYWKVAQEAEKILAAYPGRFSELRLGLAYGKHGEGWEGWISSTSFRLSTGGSL